jgi:hypothetical protein
MTRPDLKIVVFSQNARTSQALIAKVKKFASALGATGVWKDRFPGQDKTKVTVIPLQIDIPKGTSARALQGPEFHGSTIRALPCTVDGMSRPCPVPPSRVLRVQVPVSLGQSSILSTHSLGAKASNTKMVTSGTRARKLG